VSDYTDEAKKWLLMTSAQMPSDLNQAMAQVAIGYALIAIEERLAELTRGIDQ
jgi:hypothetical protein